MKDHGCRLGIHIGGTFIDFSMLKEDGELLSLKTPLILSSPIQAVATGLQILTKKKMVDPSAVNYCVYGSAVGVNTLIQRNGAKLCLFITEGFGDILEIQRMRVPVFDLYSRRPVALIPRDRVMEIKERISSDGSILTPLGESSVTKAIEQAIDGGAEGIVICLLNAHMNPEHELKIKKMVLKQASQVFVCCSTEVWPEAKEYERAIATIINAYIQPSLKYYIESMGKMLKEARIDVVPYITKSNGGVTSVRRARTACVKTLCSGPAAGVVGAAYVAKVGGYKNILTLDINSRGTEMALVTEGQLSYTDEAEVGGFPLFIPRVRTSSICIGDSSTVRADASGMLNIGPENAGADPGPACYGLGGTECTVTDALLVCGLLDSNFADGQLGLHPNLAEESIERLGQRLNLHLKEAAWAVIEIALAELYAGLSRLFSREAVRPHNYTLVAFGSAGPLIGCFLAEELKIPRVLVPMVPGTLRALGSIVSEIKENFTKTVMLRLSDVKNDQLNRFSNELKRQALKWLAEEGISVSDSTFRFSVGMRYVGQSFGIEVPLDESWLTHGNLGEISKAFYNVSSQAGASAIAPTEITSIRLVVSTYKGTKPQLKKIPKAVGEPEPMAVKPVYYRRGQYMCKTYRHKALSYGHTLNGPALIMSDGSTLLIAGGFHGNVDYYGNIIVEKE